MVLIVTTRQLRMLRAAVFATLCVAMAATAHLSMSEAELPVPVLAAAFAGVLSGTWLLAGRRRGLAAVSGWMVAAQAALHVLFDTTASATHAARATRDWAVLLLCTPDGLPAGTNPADLARAAGLDPDALSMPGSMPDMPGMAGMTGMADTAGTAGAVYTLSAGMLAGHLLAALACALLLWRGEAALTGISGLLHALANALLPLLLLLVPHRYEPLGPALSMLRRARPPRPALLTHAVVRRGPPAPPLV